MLYCDSPDSSALGAKHQAQSRAKHWLISLEHAGLGALERHSDTGDGDRAFLPKHVLKGRAAPRAGAGSQLAPMLVVFSFRIP